MSNLVKVEETQSSSTLIELVTQNKREHFGMLNFKLGSFSRDMSPASAIGSVDVGNFLGSVHEVTHSHDTQFLVKWHQRDIKPEPNSRGQDFCAQAALEIQIKIAH